MTPLSRDREICLCAFCRNPRRVYRKKHISAIHALGVAALSVFASYAIFQQLHPIGLVVGVTLMTACEVFFQFRWRLSLPCLHCGFDPLLYLRDPEKTAAQVKKFVAERLEQPEQTLRRDPLRHLRARLRENNSTH